MVINLKQKVSSISFLLHFKTCNLKHDFIRTEVSQWFSKIKYFKCVFENHCHVGISWGNGKKKTESMIAIISIESSKNSNNKTISGNY